MPIIMSDKQRRYFDRIASDVASIFDLADRARKQGKCDPATEVECPPALDMAGRVETLVGPKGIGDIIRQWIEEGADQDEICFRAMDWILEDKIGTRPQDAKVDLAIRLALAIKTEGVVSAPLEGIGRIVIRNDVLGGPPYLSLYFAGPIRAAGGTVQAFAVLVADYVREKMGIAPWKATEEEVARLVEEIKLYDRIMNLQYPSTPEELAFAVRNLTVELNGDPTEDQEVSAHRDLPRMETNTVRGGPCLVLNDGVLLKSKKILKTVEKRKMASWYWLKELKKFQHAEEQKKVSDSDKDKAKDYGGDTYKGNKQREDGGQKDLEPAKENAVLKRRKELNHKNPPLDKFIADIIGGRPVFGYPSRVGGHRIRYGRSRNTGLAACGMHPSQMIILEKFLAVGTQIRIERPGKSGSSMPVTSIEPPIILLENGDVKQLWSIQDAKEYAEKRAAKKILFLGDILFGFGEFAENNHTIIPSGYVEEWWAEELAEKLKNPVLPQLHSYPDLNVETLRDFALYPFDKIPTGLQALQIAECFGIGVYPRYLDHWGNIDGVALLAIRQAVEHGLRTVFQIPANEEVDLRQFSWEQIGASLTAGLAIPQTAEVKTALEEIFCPHTVEENMLRIDPHRALFWIEMLGFGQTRAPTIDLYTLSLTAADKVALDLFPTLTTLRVPDKAPYYMGSRMGRPEKAKERKMKPPVHVLFPLSHDSELQRSVQAAASAPAIEVDLCQKRCDTCNTVTFLNKCPKCGNHTDFMKVCNGCKGLFDASAQKCPKCQMDLSFFSTKKIQLKKYLDEAISHIPKKIPIVKGVKGMSSEFKSPEPLEKGILRAINEVWVYKDGTARADAIDVPVTHITCREIQIDVDTIRSLGYDEDIYGQPITDENQVIELKVQDVLLNHHLGDYFVRVANFVDDELEYLYGMPRFYNLKDKKDLIGHYFVGLAPHTSAGIVGRLLGFSQAECGYAHPFWQAAKRRNCFPPESTVLIEKDHTIQRITFQDLYDLFDNEHIENGALIRDNSQENIQVFAYDQSSNRTTLTNINNVVKIESPSTLIEFQLKSGRTFSTTLDHPVIIHRNGQLIVKKAVEVLPDDKFLISKIDVPEVDRISFDLLQIFTESRFSELWDALMVRGIADFSRTLIDQLGGLATAARKLGIVKNTLFNFYGVRDSIPLSILLKLLQLSNKSIDCVPYCSFGFKQDDTLIPRIIPVNEELMRIIGYYIAEGFYRHDTDCYQIDLAAHEEDVRQDMLRCIVSVFGTGIHPYVNDYRITIGNRVLYYFFKDIMELSNTARTKRIPAWIMALPENKLTPLLAAYFSGDGGVDLTHNSVGCTSFSPKLIQDLDFLLLRCGIFSNLSHSTREANTEYRIRLTGDNLIAYHRKINFTYPRKQELLNQIVMNGDFKSQKLYHEHRLVSIRSIRPIKASSDHVYSLHADTHHSILINEHILTHQCDGDEDGIMLLLECLLNFSRAYLPSKLGGKMDAPLVISTRLDPREVDGESHNVDYMSRYPLQFYLDSLNYAKPGDVEKYIITYKKMIGKEGQFEGCRFTHPTASINLGPHKSAYTVFGTMAEKIESQLWLARVIQAVDAQDIARKVISSHFAPDILGNIRSYSTQSFRCPKCGAKYRRIPLMGKCIDCGGKLLMTVNPGGITKYLSKSLSMIKDFNLSAYTAQRWKLIEMYVTSLTNNPKVKQKSIASFFK
jgi:DNA polymerase II large subunit